MSETTEVVPSAPQQPERIGPYHILQVLGEGGMGIVYEAEETEPVRRRVALKVIRVGLDSRHVLARFQTERQALAVMDHPAIAKVLHAGTTEEGRPYFAMELVKGLPITRYCDLHRLSVRQRVELFIAVAFGVQHAHQKGVIHRDLKPSNILVAEQDGVAQPKIIDFGIAKALGAQVTDHTLVTQFGQMIGTAAYMSPEQADSSAAMDVDTRSDIYALGVMLFELLVGRLPYDPEQMGVHAFLARLAAGDTLPPTPSEKLVTLGADQRGVASNRRTEPTHLRRELRGDLDWIVMKAMESDRTRRYETANALANDLRHHLANEPVAARPPHTAYRLAKFIRRHRAAVLAAVVVVVAMFSAAVVATVGLLRARRAEAKAAQEAAAATQVTDFLVDLFHVSDPARAGVSDTTLSARELLDRGASRVVTGLSNQPLLQSRLMTTLGTVDAALGRFAQAQRLLDSALRVRESQLGPNDPAVAEVLNVLGDVAREKGDFDAAERSYQRALTIRQKAFGPVNIDVASTLSGLAALRVKQRRMSDAESLYSRALALDARLRAPDDQRLARDLRDMGVVYLLQKRYAEAEPMLRRALAIEERTLGSAHADVGSTLNNLGVLYWSLGRYDEALGYYDRARQIYERVLGPLHPRYASTLNNLGETYWKLKRYGEAEPLLRRALEIKQRTLEPDNPAIAETLHSLAGLYEDQGRYEQASDLYRRVLEIREKRLGAKHPDVANTMREYAEALRRAGHARAADSVLALSAARSSER